MARRVKKITCEELNDMINDKQDFVLLDVREPEEFEICSINGSVLVPLGELEDHIEEFDPEKSYIIHCKMGNRSQEAARLMAGKGFKNVKHLKGGIHKWATDIDSHMLTY